VDQANEFLSQSIDKFNSLFETIPYVKPKRAKKTKPKPAEKKTYRPSDSHYYKYGHTLVKNVTFEDSDYALKSRCK
jgi:hypothetical protein